MASSARRLLQTNSGQFPIAAADSDVVFILAALLCAVVCFVGLAAVARCACSARSRRGHDSAAAPSSGLADAASKGLEKKALRALPKLAYEDAVAARGRCPGSLSAAGDEEKILAECAICLSEFAAREEIRVLPQCGHGFHVACVDAWLRSKSSCPSCRRVLVLVDGTMATCNSTPAQERPPLAQTNRCRRCEAVELASSSSSAARF